MSNNLQGAGLRGLTSPAAFREFTDIILSMGFNATLDSPQNSFAMDWAAMFPDAKVLLTVRDTPQQWAKSMDAMQDAFRYSYARPVKWFIGTD